MGGDALDRVAVFVDAGYLFAQGSVLIAGSKRPRRDVALDVPAIISELAVFAGTKALGCSLLRIYWYDGAIGGVRPTADQALLANSDHVKLRLGFVNSLGQQKGVDSLIVTDLIELARQKSICDAVLMSGDEDVRVGVQIAQNYGVKVHLLGIMPSRGSQSPQLIQEADTASVWSLDTVSRFLNLRSATPVTPEAGSISLSDSAPAQISQAFEGSGALDSAVTKFVEGLQQSDLEGIVAYWETDRGVPTEFDRRLLPCGREAIGRDLDQREKRFVRSRFQMLVKVKFGKSA